MKECYNCGFNDEDYGCTCPHSDKWYACPVENKKPENIQALEDCEDFFAEARACSISEEDYYKNRIIGVDLNHAGKLDEESGD